jgi:predicted ATPase/class 3 adenylate cyclase
MDVAELPTGTVTFLFTDLESSSRLWEEQREAMRAALARHDEILRRVVEAEGGQVVKGTGDGLHAVFASAEAAVAAAVDAQRALGSEPWGSIEPLRVRMGLHTGAAELRGEDYFGPVLNRAARVMAAGHGGQVLVSAATQELTRDRLPEGCALVELGEFRLRDLGRPERIFQVVHPDLAEEFPRLRTLDALPANLPVQVTSFVGRDEDVARIVALLEDASLMTLTGTGGVGKTRLAVQVAAEVLPRFADGAWFCELAAVDDGEAMAQVVAATIGCLQRPGLSLAESIVEYLRVRELLLVLDNCEHLLDESGEFADSVVRSCPKVRVVATSREALDVAGERVVRVRSLSAPAGSAPADELIGSAAVQLFVDRAADAGIDTGWDDRQWTAVGEICRRVDGIPLAIELAAARTTSMSPTEVAAHLDERFRLLTGKRRGRVERHQTLRATVEWSYQLLDGEERMVFDRLGVFAGTFDAPAAIAVASGDDLDGWEVTEALSGLVAKSMLVPETSPDGTTRYGMLETLRQFARERLEERGETDRWRGAHARQYAASTHEIGYGSVGPDHVLWVARFRADLDNIRAAVGWALERDDADERELALRILASLEEAGRSYPDTGLGALATQAMSDAELARPELRVPVVTLAAFYEWNQGRTERALELVRDAQREGIVMTSVDPLAPYQGRVIFEMAAGHHAQALEIANSARAEIDVVDNPYSEARFLGAIASFESMAGLFEQARADAERALDLARRSRNVALIVASLQSIAWALQRDDPVAALAASEEYVDLYREFGVGIGAMGNVLALAGGLRARLGDDTGALELLRDAVTFARDQGMRPQFAAALDWSLSPLLRTGKAEIAASFLGALTDGPLADVSNWPGVADRRSHSLGRARNLLGDTTETHLARGAAMSYGELAEYAICHLDPTG